MIINGKERFGKGGDNYKMFGRNMGEKNKILIKIYSEEKGFDFFFKSKKAQLVIQQDNQSCTSEYSSPYKASVLTTLMLLTKYQIKHIYHPSTFL